MSRLYLTDTPTSFNPLGVDFDALIDTRGDAAVSDTAASDNDGVPDFVNDGVSGEIIWYSPPLAAVTISGTVTFNVRMAESSMNANSGAYVRITRVDGSGNEISNIINSARGVEMGTAEAAQSWTGTPTSTTLSDGDRIAIRVGNTQVGTGATGHTITLWYDGPTAGASGDSYVDFTETLTEYVAATDPRYATRLLRRAPQAVNRASTY